MYQWGCVNARSGQARGDTNWTKRLFSLGQGSRPTSSSLAAPPLHHEPINATRSALSRRQHGRGNGRQCSSSFQFVSANIIRQRPYRPIIIVRIARLMNAMAICRYRVIFGRTNVTLKFDHLIHSIGQKWIFWCRCHGPMDQSGPRFDASHDPSASSNQVFSANRALPSGGVTTDLDDSSGRPVSAAVSVDRLMKANDFLPRPKQQQQEPQEEEETRRQRQQRWFAPTCREES